MSVSRITKYTNKVFHIYKYFDDLQRHFFHEKVNMYNIVGVSTTL